eukprot:GHRQ01014904.1.p1 GENE.GHRQ01014904.1~~GHRQ01014904.1.p1  ORF type:complete len:144 (-),score=20.43 GHRQ01014904.1:1025-1456(-)
MCAADGNKHTAACEVLHVCTYVACAANNAYCKTWHCCITSSTTTSYLRLVVCITRCNVCTTTPADALSSTATWAAYSTPGSTCQYTGVPPTALQDGDQEQLRALHRQKKSLPSRRSLLSTNTSRQMTTMNSTTYSMRLLRDCL